MVEKKGEEEEKSHYVITRFQNRLTALKKGQDHSQHNRIADAVRYYNEYLNAIAEYHEVKVEKLSPKLFNAEKEVAEILLISQVYWDLAKAYDRSPKLASECERCLKQFALFTIGFKFQYLNSEMIRKFIKKRNSYHPEYFEQTYKDMRVHSKKCYVATYCYGETHYITSELRVFKTKIDHTYLGAKFIELYYRVSPRVVNFCDSHKIAGEILSSFILRPLVRTFFYMQKIIR